MSRNGRTAKGQFAKGNAGGPGRPRRPTEMKYLAALADGVTLDDWRAVVRAAVRQAKSGDGKARDWLTRHLIGDDPPALTELVASEAYGDEADIIAALSQKIHRAKYLNIAGDADIASDQLEAFEKGVDVTELE